MRSLTLLQSACLPACRTTRYGDFVVVTLQSAAFVTPAMDFQQAEAWARSRSSLGSTHRDRGAFLDRHETLLARNGSGIATKGARAMLARLVKGMEQCGMDAKEWSVPHNIFESVEIQKRKPPADPSQPAGVTTEKLS